MRYDLHTHSTASDGSQSATDLVTRAASLGVDCLALTDHDTLAGIAEAKSAAEKAGISFVPGAEISVSWEGTTLHVLGLGLDLLCPSLLEGLGRLQTFRSSRAQEIGERLSQAGIPDAYAGAALLATGKLISRTHFAQFLIAAGFAKDVRDVFKRYLVKGKPGHVPGQWASLTEALAWIQAAGGFAVLAHPARYDLSAGSLRRLLQEFKAGGGVGIEVISGNQDQKTSHSLADYARRYDLYASVGSDYHGASAPWRELGRMADLPKNVRPIWEHEHWTYLRAGQELSP